MAPSRMSGSSSSMYGRTGAGAAADLDVLVEHRLGEGDRRVVRHADARRSRETRSVGDAEERRGASRLRPCGSPRGADSPTFRRRGAAFRPDPPVGIVPAMPSPRPSRPNLAARAGRWSASHRRTAILGWIAFVVAAVVLGQAVGFKQSGDGGVGEAGPAAA